MYLETLAHFATLFSGLGFSRHGAHGGHYHDAGCWMFDGGIFEPALVQKLRTHGLLRGFIRTLHADDRDWLLRDNTARKMLRDVHFVPADASQQLQETVERLRGNIDAATNIHQRGTLAELVPPASRARVARVLALAEMSDDDRAEAETTRRHNEMRAQHQRAAQLGGLTCCPLICILVAGGLCAHFLVKQIDRMVARNTSHWLGARTTAIGTAGVTNTRLVRGTDDSAIGNLTVHGKRMQELFAWTVTTGLAVGGVALAVVGVKLGVTAAAGLTRRVMAVARTSAMSSRASPTSAASTWSTVRPATAQSAQTGAAGAARPCVLPLPALLRAAPSFWAVGVPVTPPRSWPGR